MPATIEDLYKVEGKAELVCGEIVYLMPSGGRPGFASLLIASSLLNYSQRTLSGYAYADGTGFRVNLPNRQSFSPDAAYHAELNLDIKFVEGAPIFAVEIRSESDYGPKAELDMAAKRADYFAAGTRIVWDVDTLGEDVIKKYIADNPDAPTIFRRGETADAEPALLGWEMPVNSIFPYAR